MSAKCNLCESPIIWDQPYVKGSRPKNEDGSTHSCKKTETSTESVSATLQKQTPITSVSVLAEIEAFRTKFGPIESDARFDALARIYISRMMRR